MGHPKSTPCHYAKASISSMMEILPDAILTKVLAWMPMTCHRGLRGTSKRFKSIINSKQFRAVRLAEGFAESAIVVYAEPVSGGSRKRQIWALINGRWRLCPWTAGSDEFPSVVARNSGKDSLLFIGDYCNTTSSKYRISDGDQPTLPPHIEQRCLPAVCHYGQCTVLAGGHRVTDTDAEVLNCEPLSSAEVFDPEIGEWTMLPSMPYPTDDAVAGVLGQKMHVAGSRGRPHPHFQVYDIVAENWELGVPIPELLYHVSGAVVNEMFHLVGESTERKIYTFFIFDAGRQAWTETSPICETGGSSRAFRRFCRAFEHNGRLLVLCWYVSNYLRAPLSQLQALHQLEDNGEWSEILLSKVPNALLPPMTVAGIREVFSIVLG